MQTGFAVNRISAIKIIKFLMYALHPCNLSGGLNFLKIVKLGLNRYKRTEQKRISS